MKEDKTKQSAGEETSVTAENSAGSGTDTQAAPETQAASGTQAAPGTQTAADRLAAADRRAAEKQAAADAKTAGKNKPELTKRQQKNRRHMMTACISLAVVVILAVAVSFTLGEVAESEEEETATYGVMEMDPDDVVRIEIHNTYDNMNFYYDEDDDTWYYEDDTDFPVNQTVFTQIAESIEELYSEVEIEATSDRLQEYGLSDSDVIVSVFDDDEDGTEETYYLGSYNSTMGGYYFYNSYRDLIYIVDSTFGNLFDVDLYTYAEVDSFPTLDSTTFVSVEKRTDGELDYYLEYIPEGISDNMYSTMTWYFGSPFGQMQAVAEDKATDMMSDIASLDFEKTVNYYCTGDDLAQYGLDSPQTLYFYYYTVSGTDDDGETTYNSCVMELKVGDKDDTGEYYYTAYRVFINGLLSTDNKKVSLIDADDLAWLLNLDPFDYMYMNIFYAGLSDIETIELQYNDEVYVFTVEIDEEGETVLSSNGEYAYSNSAYTFYLNGATITDGDEMRNAYLELVSLKIIEFIEDDEKKIDVDPTITWTITMPDNELSEIVVELTPYDASSYQVTVNGVTDFKCSRQEALDAIDAMISMVDYTE
ncbi:MAG: DUF4340 domain-containing protein [Lachnospiraceae bacterium]|nr:DUF4340 domain-containing protein [Lachnospiraceae bacterium]